MTVNVLGQNYQYSEANPENGGKLYENYGYTDRHEKTIVVVADLPENDPQGCGNTDDFKRVLRRHELIHAFLYESGMREWSEDEALVDWLAIQWPKMQKAFGQVGAVAG